MSIHTSAVVSDEARIDPDATIGPFCVIEGRVTIGAGTVVESNARIGNPYGRVHIGRDNLIQHGAVLGGAPQDYGYRQCDTELVIGDRNRIGEYVSINTGTEKGGGVTRVADDVFIMAYSHLGHDCQIEEHVLITNGTQLAGHVTVEKHAKISGLSGITQFCRIGTHAFLTAGAFANKDIAPFTIAEGHWAAPRAVNRIGLQRAGFDADEVKNIGRAVAFLADRSLTIAEALERIAEECAPSPQIEHFVAFIASSERGIARR